MSLLLTKGRTLKSIKNSVTLFKVPKMHLISIESWLQNKSENLRKIKDLFKDSKIVVRSSADDEDMQNSSLAGQYESILNIESKNTEKISSAITNVIESYKRNENFLSNDEILIQEMVAEVSMSGVIFTYDLNTGAPYYVINYDDQSGLTNTVTSGDGEYSNRTLYIHRNKVALLKSRRFINLISAVKELETLLNNKFLDIEFALDINLKPYLFQVRSISTSQKWDKDIISKVNLELRKVELDIRKKFDRVPGLSGEKTLFGQMPDWNPVEMIGRAPGALAFSLYDHLITRSSWSLARHLMGYQYVKDKPLMVDIAGQPYIDVRLSFNSFIPKNLSANTADKLINYWVSLLKDRPELHDKVEFDICITCFSFDMDEKLKEIPENIIDFSEKIEFKDAHLKLTKKLITGNSINEANHKIDQLAIKQKKYSKDNNISTLTQMIEDCIELGTVPFAILARHAFIAKTILNSLIKKGALELAECDLIYASTKTVASELVEDICTVYSGNYAYDSFMKKYGHLRPGTYDIMSKRYDQMDNILSTKFTNDIKIQNKSFSLSSRQKKIINMLLQKNKFNDFDAENLIDYVQKTIVAREYSKFVFTRSVSSILEKIAFFAKTNSLTREEISNISIEEIISSFSKGKQAKNNLKYYAKKGKDRHDISKAIRLPQILYDENSIHIIPFQVSYPNFITKKKVIADCLFLDSNYQDINLDRKIIIIESADPGFDWIFSHNISGLITKYGGANSHMAIRCAEFEIPAAIGAGEQRFELIKDAKKLHLNCSTGLINVIH